MSALHAIAARLFAGRPLLMSGDPLAALASRGLLDDGPGSVGKMLRESPSAASEHYRLDVAAGVDVLCALTAFTSPRALASIGMAFRAAVLTAAALDLAREEAQRAGRAVAVAGALGGLTRGSHDEARIVEEYASHAARIAVSGADLVVARGHVGPSAAGVEKVTRTASIVSAASTDRPAWAVVAIEAGGHTVDGEPVESCANVAADAGAAALICEVASADAGVEALERAARCGVRLPLGVLIAAPPAGDPAIDAWVRAARRVVEAGARILGGGEGTTARHTRALAALLDEASRPATALRPMS